MVISVSHGLILVGFLIVLIIPYFIKIIKIANNILTILKSFYPKRQKRLGFLLEGFEALIEKVVWFKLYFSFSP
ncbi:hypothetical protein ECC40_01805 [Helicobacter pylori]|nr:hypothetical protein ECC40_01805 [Helicobacter pylori]